ncbi:SVM family protein [Candidatus Phytoplasma fraxini]|uniref:Sequence-variable mosaic (SVM) signal sequence domain-containing protein n=1 Tax=Ash yellows phytoplasma TaxID=35780 RepID=A0ABZ2U7M2_ASHYP
MFKLQNQFKIISFCLIIFLGFLFIFNNQVMAAPKKEHGKEIASSKEPEKTTKQDVKNYFELYNALEEYSDEDRNKIIKILQDPELTQMLQNKNEKKTKKLNEKGSSSKKSDDSKK